MAIVCAHPYTLSSEIESDSFLFVRSQVFDLDVLFVHFLNFVFGKAKRIFGEMCAGDKSINIVDDATLERRCRRMLLVLVCADAERAARHKVKRNAQPSLLFMLCCVVIVLRGDLFV